MIHFSLADSRRQLYGRKIKHIFWLNASWMRDYSLFCLCHIAVEESRTSRSGWLNRKWTCLLQRRVIHFNCVLHKHCLRERSCVETGENIRGKHTFMPNYDHLHSVVGAFFHQCPRDDSRIRCAQVFLPGENYCSVLVNLEIRYMALKWPQYYAVIFRPCKTMVIWSCSIYLQDVPCDYYGKYRLYKINQICLYTVV